MIGRPRRPWLLAAVALGGIVAGAALYAWWRGSTPTRRLTAVGPPDVAALEGATPGGAVPVRDNPGWEALSEEDRHRADQPLSDSARDWLVQNRPLVIAVAGSMGVSAVALGGIVAAEKTLLTGRTDALAEDLFRTVFGSLREKDLRRWVDGQEERFRRGAEGAPDPTGFPIRNPYLWTLGPAQVSFRLAVQYEPAVAHHLRRPERDVKEIVRAVTSTSGNLEYAAALLVEAQRAYAGIAGMDISANPGLLATLYHLGAPTVRARRLAADNAARQARGEPPMPPQVNFYGAFVNRHAAEIAGLLGEPEEP